MSKKETEVAHASAINVVVPSVAFYYLDATDMLECRTADQVLEWECGLAPRQEFAMNLSKTIILATLFSFAAAGAWLPGTQSSGAETETHPSSPAKEKEPPQTNPKQGTDKPLIPTSGVKCLQEEQACLLKQEPKGPNGQTLCPGTGTDYELQCAGEKLRCVNAYNNCTTSSGAERK